MKPLTYIILALLAIMFVVMLAYYLGVFEGTKLPKIEPVNLAPEYEIPWTDSDGKG